MAEVRIAALYTAARYENTYCRNMIDKAISDSGLKLAVSLGVFYGQCMQMMMEDVSEKGCDFILTVDGDSLITRKNIDRLIYMIANREGIDALAAMQVRRSMRYPLFTVGNSQSVDVDPTEPFPVTTAHFGLTAIRASKLLQTPKPWFASKCSPEGTWGRESGKVDDDIWFWNQWKEAGNTVYIDPGCCIGHMEEMIAVYGPDMKPTHIYPKDWEEQNYGKN